MAQFKLELLTPISRDGAVYYTSSVLTDFVSQTLGDYQNYLHQHETYSFTGNEKFSEHKNAQKDLSFSMHRKLWQGEYWIDNPYVDNVHVGSQLLLTDKYGSEHLFTVVSIKYNIQQTNTEYQVTCEDTFNYQTIRQNDGYTIKNDATDEDFIGAKTADWWVTNKIHPECYISYEFLPFRTGLYRSFDGEYLTFTEDSQLTKVDEIIKPLYTDELFFETLPFSCSGSNGMAALITLAEQLGCQINTFEHRFTDINGYVYFRKNYWLAPSKNTLPSGLTYSPFQNIQSFNVSQTGNSLTTVLNIQSHTINDEEIGLFPSLPGIFLNYFHSNEWKHSSYYPGMFNDIINGQFFTNVGDEANINLDISVSNVRYNNARYHAVQIQNDGLQTFFWPIYYNQFKMKWPNKQSIWQFIDDEDDRWYNTSTTTLLLFVARSPLKSYSGLDKVYDDSMFLRQDVLVLKEGDILPAEWLGQRLYCYWGIPQSGNNEKTRYTHLYLTLSRDFTESEKLFAEAADACPWLENKLVDFSYFLHHNILSKAEYESLMDLFMNDIRIVNGQLMAASQSYYRALHQQTKIMSDLTAKIDTLGAEFYASVIRPYSEEGAIHSLEDFDKAYRSLFQNNNQAQKTSIVNYNELLSETFVNYFDAEQRFLRNIYNFRNYFNTVNSFSSQANACIALDKLQLDTSTWVQAMRDENGEIKDTYNLAYFSFAPSQYESIYNKDGSLKEILYHAKTKTPLTTFFEYDEIYRPVEVVTKHNITKFYRPEAPAGALVQITNQDTDKFLYNENCDYFIKKEEYDILFESFTTDNLIDRTVEFPEGELKVPFVRLEENEIKYLYLRKHLERYYLRDTQRYIPLDWIRYSHESNNISVIKQISQGVFTGCNYRYLLSFLCASEDGLIYDTISPFDEQDNNDLILNAWAHYKYQCPIVDTYYYGPVFRAISQQDDNTILLSRLNEKHQTQEEYDIDPKGTRPNNYQTLQPIAFYNQPLTEYIQPSEYSDFYNRGTTSFSYYAYNWDEDTSLWGWLTLCPLVGIGSWIAAAAKYNARSWRVNYHPRKAIPQEYAKDIYDYSNLGNINASHDNLYQQPFIYDSTAALFLKAADNLTVRKDYSKALVSQYQGLDTNQYFNYYNLIAATYSFEYKLPYTTNNKTIIPTAPYLENDQFNGSYKFWTQNKYWRILPAYSTINRRDRYYMLPFAIRMATDSDSSLNTWEEWETFLIDDNNQNKQFIYLGYKGKAPFSNHIEFANFAENKYDSQHLLKIFDVSWDNRKYSQIQYYFWKPFMTEMEWEKEGWDSDDCRQLNYKYLTKDNTTLPFISLRKDISQESDEYTYMDILFVIVHEENYEEALLGTVTNYQNYWDNYIDNAGYTIALTPRNASEPIYTRYTDARFNTYDAKDLFQPHSDCHFYMISKQDSYFVPCTSADWDETGSISYYAKEADSYVRRYSIPQLIAHPQPYSCLANSSKEFTNFIDNETDFSAEIYLHHLRVVDGEIEHYSVVQYPDVCKFTFINTNELQYSIVYQGQEYTTTVRLYRDNNPTYLNRMSNGEFWYRYHARVDLPIIFESCAFIETELTIYWQQALGASKYCGYFLPDAWQPTTETALNHFDRDIITVEYNKDNNNNPTLLKSVNLSNRFLPEVQLYADPVLNPEKPTWLPKYQMTLNIQADYSYLMSWEQQQINNMNIQSAASICANNPAIRSLTDHLLPGYATTMALSSISLEEIGKCNYYYAISGGLKWNDVLNYCSFTSTIYPQYDGIYGLQFNILYHNFTNRPVSQYDALMKEKSLLWQKIYRTYPNVLLETSFSYDKATTSDELLRMAKLAMKDKIQTENSYSLSLIDSHNLQGYKGQKIMIGDSIALAVNDFYDKIDDLYELLSQYLFITDISYSLRSDTDINITVNTIKYQDKLLQQLVKLIR